MVLRWNQNSAANDLSCGEKRSTLTGFAQEGLGGSWQKMDIGARMGEVPNVCTIRLVAFGLIHAILFER